MPARWSRRSVLGLGLVGALTVAGCSEGTPPEQDVRTDPPPRPEAPTIVADVPALLEALERTRQLHRRAALVTGAQGQQGWVLDQAVAALAGQERVLEDVLVAGGVAVPPADPVPSPTATPAPSDATTATAPAGDAATTSVDPAERTRRERERARQLQRALNELGALARQDVTADALTALSRVSSANLAMLTSVSGQRGALAAHLGATPRWEALPGPAGAVAAAVLPGFQAAVYAFEVIAARESGERRELAERTLTRLRPLSRGLTALAGPAAAPAPLGYGIEAELSTAEGRTALAHRVLAALPPAVVAGAGGHSGDRDAVAGTVRLLAEAVELAGWWRLATPPFPGMTLP